MNSSNKDKTKRMNPLQLEELNNHTKPTKRNKVIKILDRRSVSVEDTSYIIINKE